MSFFDEVRKITDDVTRKKEKKRNNMKPIKSKEIKLIEKLIKKAAKKGEYYVDVYYKYNETFTYFQKLGFSVRFSGFNNSPPPYAKIMTVDWNSKEIV